MTRLYHRRGSESDPRWALCDNTSIQWSHIDSPSCCPRVDLISSQLTARTRTVILHAHMFKNAGTTLDWSLRRYFEDKFVDHRDDDAMRKSGSYLSSYIKDHPNLRALSSHWLPFPPPDMADTQTRVLMLLRDPLERSRSVYNFERAQEAVNSPGNKKARSLGFEDYVKWRLEPGTGPVIKNFHTRFCSGNFLGENMGKLYDQARANLDSTLLIGLVHRYSESMALFEHGLETDFPGIDLSWKTQNSTQALSVPLANRLKAVALELGSTLSALTDANKYDIMLLQHAEQLLDHRLTQIPNLDARLHSIHQRNEILK
jgi:hypothetical protein